MKRSIRIRRMTAWICACLLLLSWAMIAPMNARAEQSVVRVLLTKLELTNRLTAALDGSYTLGSLSFQRGSKITFSCDTGVIIAYYEGMAVELGKEARLIRHAAEAGAENGLRINGGYPLYCGDLVIATDGRQLSAVLYIPVEEYLLGVVPYEMNDAFPLEALKAQAVAARTYALRKIGSSGNYDLVDNTNDQVYRGYQKENVNAALAVAETAGICGYDKKQLAICYYTASNGGQVELAANVWGPGEGAYITMHEDHYDVENPESVVKKAFIEKTPKDGIIGNMAFTDAVKMLLSEPISAMGFTGEKEDIRIVAVTGMTLHTPKDNAESLVMTKLRMTVQAEARRMASQAMINDEEKSIFQMPATTSTPAPRSESKSPFIPVEQSITVDVPVFTCIKPLLGLGINGSDNEIFTVTEGERGFEIGARRYGHGVGMSQRGAQWMADKYGWTYEQILHFYYPGLNFKKTETAVTLAPPVSAAFLATPGPAATPTPRPTVMPVTHALGPGEWRAKVTQIGTNSSLNLRSAPSTNADILRVLYYGQELIVTKRLEDGWLAVKTDVIEGYVMEKFVEKMD